MRLSYFFYRATEKSDEIEIEKRLGHTIRALVIYKVDCYLAEMDDTSGHQA